MDVQDTWQAWLNSHLNITGGGVIIELKKLLVLQLAFNSTQFSPSYQVFLCTRAHGGHPGHRERFQRAHVCRWRRAGREKPFLKSCLGKSSWIRWHLNRELKKNIFVSFQKQYFLMNVKAVSDSWQQRVEFHKIIIRQKQNSRSNVIYNSKKLC